MSRPITPKDVAEQRRIPEPSEVRAVLDEYFVGPITDEIVMKLWAYVERVMRNKPLHAGEMSSFDPANGGIGFGEAWREQLARGRVFPSSIDLTAWLASSTRGYPEPKPYCPEIFVGRWIENVPDSGMHYMWELEPDGRFRTDEPFFSDRIRWCVHRQGDGPKGDAIWLDDKRKISHEILLVLDVTPTSLTVKRVGAEIHVLVRAGAEDRLA